MAGDVRISTSLQRHPKTIRLIKLLGYRGFYGLISLFLWTAENRPDGSLYGLSSVEVDSMLGWSRAGVKGGLSLCSALATVGYLDGEPGSYSVHDWPEHNPWVASKTRRINAARTAAEIKWAHERDAASAKAHSAPNPTLPNPTLPNPTLPNTEHDWTVEGDVAFERFCKAYSNFDVSTAGETAFEKTVLAVRTERGCTERDAVEYLIDRAKVYCSVKPGQYQQAMINWLEKGTYGQNEANWRDDGKRPATYNTDEAAAQRGRIAERVGRRITASRATDPSAAGDHGGPA